MLFLNTSVFLICSGVILSYTCIISYDEGPSKNLSKVINEGVSLQIPLVFFLDPFTPSFNKEKVEEILNNGYEVGMSLTEEVNEDTILDILSKYEKEFIKKSEYKPRLLRLPAVGLINDKIISKISDYTVDIPNLDSEDDQKSDIWPFLSNALYYEDRPDISLVFRERYDKSIDLLKYVVDLLWKKGYKIVSAGEYYNTDISPKFIGNTNLPITKYEVIRNSKPYSIRVYTLLNDKEVKEVIVKYNVYNKLFIRQLLTKEDINKDLNDLYNTIINTCGLFEDEEVKTLQEETNGVVSICVWYCVLIILMM